MPKRKPDDKAQLNIRMTEALRRKIAAEADKSGWSINSELVRRLERSFIDQGVESLIKSTALAVGIEVTKNVSDLNANLHDHLNALAMAVGRPDLKFNSKEEDSNG